MFNKLYFYHPICILELTFEKFFKNNIFYGIFLLLTFLLCTNVGAAQNISFDNTVSPEIEICSDTKTFAIAFTNNTTATLNQVSLALQLPQGIYYEGGSLNNIEGGTVQELGIPNQETISFSISDLDVNSTISFNVELSAHFDAYTFHTNGGIFRNKLTLNYSGGSKTIETEPYNILYPALTITNVTPLSKTAFVGQTFTRKVTIVNGGYGRLSSFVLSDTYDSNLQLTSTDKGILNATKDEISFSAEDFESIGDKDGFFEQNESITITQVIVVSGCNSTQSSLQASWGCDGQREFSNVKYPYTTIKLYAPKLSVTPTPSFNTCVDGTADVQKMTFTNNGTGPANELKIDIRQEPENIYSAINPSTIRYSIAGSPNINVTTNSISPAAAFACLNDAYVGSFQVTLPQLQPNETLELFWDSYTCNTTSCGDVRLIGWEYEVNYTDMCFKNAYLEEGEGQAEKGKNFSVFYESPSDLVNKQTGEYVFILSSATFDLPEGSNPYFEVVMDIPPGLVWSGNSTDLRYVSGTEEWIPTTVNFDNNTQKLTALYPFPIPITLARSEFRLNLSLDCSLPNANGMATVGMQLFYVMDSSCPNPYKMQLTCHETPMTFLHCPGECTAGTAGNNSNGRNNADYKTITDGAWENASTWEGGSVPSKEVSGKSIIIAHAVTSLYNTSLKSGANLLIENGGSYTIQDGSIIINDAILTVSNGTLDVKYDLGLMRPDAQFNINNSSLKIGQSYRNTNGRTVMEQVNLTTGSDYLITSGSDEWINVCATIGAINGGNYVADNGTIKMDRTSIKLLNGNFENRNNANLSGNISALHVAEGNLQNTGIWTAVVDAYCVKYAVSVSNNYLPANQDCAAMGAFDCSAFKVSNSNGPAALVFQSFDIQRTNFGQPDNNIDGLPDESGSLDLSKVKTNRVMMSDTFKTIFNGKILTNEFYPSWEYGYATSTLPLYGDKLKALSAKVTIQDKSSGTVISADNVPFTTDLSGTTLTVKADFSSPTLAALGNSEFSNFVLEYDDEVEVEVFYTLEGNIGGNIEQVLVTNDFHVAPTVNGTPFRCNDWSGNVTFVGYYFTTFQGEVYNINSCTQTISQNYYLSIGNCCSNYAGGDFFPYEYRNWAVVKDLIVKIPDGFKVKNASMKYYRTAHVNKTTVEEVSDLQLTGINGLEHTYDLEQYFTSQGGTLNLSDDGFNGTVYLELDPDCTARQKRNLPVVWNYRFREVDKLGGGVTPRYKDHKDYINYVRGDLRLTTTQKTVEAISPTVSWEVKIRNRAVTPAPNTWLYIENPSNILTILKVEEISSGNIITPVNGLYQLGEFTNSRIEKYRITAKSNKCIPGEITALTGYRCEGYPTDFADVNCDFKELALAMTPQISELQTRVREIYDPAQPCDEVFGVELELLSSKLAAVKDILLSLTTPSNGSIKIVEGSTEVLYPQASGYTSVNDPTLIGNTYTLSGAEIDATIGTNGLVGISNVEANLAKIRFKFETQPNFEPGDFLQIDIAANRSCGDALPTLSLAYDPNAVFAEPENIGLESNGDNWGASWGDYNGDGHVDLFVTTHDLDSPNELFKNNGDGTFTKITSGPIATDKASSLAASWADYDNDQDLDLVVANNIGSPNFLYRNEGGGNFIRIQNDPIVNDLGYAHGISWVDYDKDGNLDLFVTSFFVTQFNTLYRNNGDGTFSIPEVNAVMREAKSSTCGVWGDYNNDGLADLFVANTNGENNSLYENKGNGNFLKINAGAIVNDGGHSVGGSWADYDNDGDLDLFVANAANENNFLYNNNGNGSFTKITSGIIVNDKGHSHGSGWADYDNDGWMDLFVANDQNQNNSLYKNNKDGTFTKIENAISQSGGMSFAAAWADYDNDGGVDLFVANRANNENFLYQNVKAACQGKSCITLVGTNSNKSAIGAKIYLTATVYGREITQMREITAQSGGGIGGQNELKSIFGLGDAGVIDEIRVVWPSGYEQILTNEMVDDCLVITEENASMVYGVIYHDENENCMRDENEVGIANQKVLLAPGSHVVYTNGDGYYQAYVPVQNYDIIPEAGNNWAMSCQAQSSQRVDVPTIGQEYGGFDFGIKATCTSPDLSVEVATTAHRIGFRNLISLTYKNSGTIAATGAILTLNLDQYVVPVESTIPWDRQEGQTLYWDFEPLPAGTSRTIYLTDSIAANTPIGQEILLVSDMDANEKDCNEQDNAFSISEPSIGALDPNDILVHPEGSIDKDEVLTYKIRFQNVGNIPVANVRVTSTLPEELDKFTFELGVGSHPFRFEQEGLDLTWEFPNIMLPDSVNNEPESHGFVTFRILPKEGLPLGTIIENKAKIFFDNMEPITTNTVQNIIQPKITSQIFGGQLLIYPNPSNGRVNIQLLPDDLQRPDNIRILELYNTQGVLIKSLHNVLEGVLVDWNLEDLSTGLYYLKAVDQNGDGYSGKVMIQR